jgi:hypothetical protein
MTIKKTLSSFCQTFHEMRKVTSDVNNSQIGGRVGCLKRGLRNDHCFKRIMVHPLS